MISSQLLKSIRDEFRQWYGLISPDEVITNSQLIRIITEIEHQLRVHYECT